MKWSSTKTERAASVFDLHWAAGGSIIEASWGSFDRRRKCLDAATKLGFMEMDELAW